MFRRMLLAVCFALVFGTAQMVSAMLPGAEMALGGISLFSKTDAVVAVYGEPDKVVTHTVGVYDKNYYYGDSVKIDIVNNTICAITVTANNGFATPSGIRVGSKAGDVYGMYGQPDRHYEQKGEKTLIYLWDEKKYCAMSITLRGGIVSKISVFENP